MIHEATSATYHENDEFSAVDYSTPACEYGRASGFLTYLIIYESTSARRHAYSANNTQSEADIIAL